MAQGPDDEPRHGAADGSNRTFVLAFVFVAVLAMAGFFLVQALVDMVRVQNCAVTGRQNC